MAFSFARQGQKKNPAADEAVTGLAADLVSDSDHGAPDAARSSAGEAKQFCKFRDKRQNDSGYFIQVGGQRWGIQSHPCPSVQN